MKAEDRISSPPDFWLLTFLTAPPDGSFPPVPLGLIHSPNLILFLLPLIAYAVSKARRF